MRKSIYLLSALAILLMGAGYYFLFYPPTLYARAAQHMLDSLSQTIATQQAAKVEAALSTIISDSATITLEVGFPPAPGQKVKDVTAENFGKPEFLRFIDNVLYSLKDYHHSAVVLSLALSADRKTGLLTFESEAEAHSIAEFPMEGKTIFRGDTLCKAGLAFGTDKTASITSLACVTQLH